MMRLLWVCLLPLLAISAGSPSRPLGQPDAEVAAMVDHLYKEVVARHPLGMPDRKIFRPYLSKGLLRGFDLEDACFDRWRRKNPDPDLKPEVGMIEFGVFTGGTDGEPQAFHIDKVETEKGGSSRVYVTLTYAEASFKLTWTVVAVVIRENGQPVVDDVVYLKHDNLDEYRLSESLKDDCKGYEG